MEPPAKRQKTSADRFRVQAKPSELKISEIRTNATESFIINWNPDIKTEPGLEVTEPVITTQPDNKKSNTMMVGSLEFKAKVWEVKCEQLQKENEKLKKDNYKLGCQLVKMRKDLERKNNVIKLLEEEMTSKNTMESNEVSKMNPAVQNMLEKLKNNKNVKIHLTGSKGTSGAAQKSPAKNIPNDRGFLNTLPKPSIPKNRNQEVKVAQMGKPEVSIINMKVKDSTSLATSSPSTKRKLSKQQSPQKQKFMKIVQNRKPPIVLTDDQTKYKIVAELQSLLRKSNEGKAAPWHLQEPSNNSSKSQTIFKIQRNL
jgi:hypothetical protein